MCTTMWLYHWILLWKCRSNLNVISQLSQACRTLLIHQLKIAVKKCTLVTRESSIALTTENSTLTDGRNGCNTRRSQKLLKCQT